MTAYLVVAYRDVRDDDALAAYAAAAGPVLAAHGANVLARGGRVISLEGGIEERTNIIAFDSIDAALTYYNSADYQAALEILGDAATRDMRIVEALD